MITCERCGLTLQGRKAHASAEECLRCLLPRYAAIEELANRQAEVAARIEQRLERAQRQVRAAEQASRTAAKDLKRERDRSARAECARNTAYSALLRAQAEGKARKTRYAKALARMRKLASGYLENAA